MQRLIDIPDYVYEHAVAHTEDSRDEAEAIYAIANSKPFHPNPIIKDLIDREEALSAVDNGVDKDDIHQRISLLPNTYEKYCDDVIELDTTCIHDYGYFFNRDSLTFKIPVEQIAEAIIRVNARVKEVEDNANG